MAHEYAPTPPAILGLIPERPPMEVPYDIKMQVAFLVDDLLEQKDPLTEKLAGKVLGPLRETNFKNKSY